jgi:alanyl-tRNA synthetase
VLGAEIGGKANLLVAVTPDLTGCYRAGDIVRQLAPLVGGSGGGKPELAQAGGSQPEKLPETLAAARDLLGGSK